MAKPFSIPAIPALAVGESTTLDYGNSLSAVKQKIKGYASRCKPPKAFSVQGAPGCPVVVTRLPDPEPQP